MARATRKERLEQLVREYFPAGTILKTSTPYNKGAVIACRLTGTALFSAPSNRELERRVEEALKDPKTFAAALKKAKGSPTLIDVPPVVERKTETEKEWGKVLSHAQAAVQISGERNPRFILDNAGLPVAIRTDTSIYKDKMSTKGGKKSKRA